MPVQLSYPGVYIQELQSGVHTITGVATSIGAFVGWAAQGPTNEAVLVQSFSDFNTLYGGLDPRSYLGYAVSQFFANGGQQAYIVRLAWLDPAPATDTLMSGVQAVFSAAGLANATLNAMKAAAAALAQSLGNPGNASLQSSATTAVNLAQGLAASFDAAAATAAAVATTGLPAALATAVSAAQGDIVTAKTSVDGMSTSLTSGVTSANLSTFQTQVQGAATPIGALAPAAANLLPLIPAGGSYAAKAKASVAGLTVQAASEGGWANGYQVTVTPSTNSLGKAVFSLALSNPSGGVVESYAGLSLTSSDPSYAMTVLNNDSQFMSFASAPPAALTMSPTTAPSTVGIFVGGLDGQVLTPSGAQPTNAAEAGLIQEPDGRFETALLAPGAGVYLLGNVPIFNLLCVPGETDTATVQTLEAFCAGQVAGYPDTRAFYIVDCPPDQSVATMIQKAGPIGSVNLTPGTVLSPTANSANAAYYYPWVEAPDPQINGRTRIFPPCGFVAGQYAATDASRGVWKAPAGIDTGLTGASGLEYTLTDGQNGSLNPVAVNCLRTFPTFGNVVWGARTLLGADAEASQWKYVPIRRLALFIESSLYDGTQWVVFEPNDTPLWAQVRLNIGSFMQGLFLQGAFQGSSPQQAYFVKCDSENNPQSNINLGILTVTVGFAPLYPAEFVVIQIQQMMAGLATS